MDRQLLFGYNICGDVQLPIRSCSNLLKAMDGMFSLAFWRGWWLTFFYGIAFKSVLDKFIAMFWWSLMNRNRTRAEMVVVFCCCFLLLLLFYTGAGGV